MSVAPSSIAAGKRLPSELMACSRSLGWRSVLARTYVEPDETDGFTTAPTPDLLLVVTITGTFTIECERSRGWSRALYRPGVIGITAPGTSSTLRWRSAPSEQRRSLHLHLSAGLLQSTADALGSPTVTACLPDALLFDDPFVLASGRALWSALEQRADPLYADSVAEALATHMVYTRLPRGRPQPTPTGARALSGPALSLIMDYMHEHLAERIVLDDLATLANVSKYHFLRVFTQATGETPHQHLVGLRMQRAAEWLRATEHTVLHVATMCGYASPTQFGRVFRRHHGATPTQYRRSSRH